MDRPNDQCPVQAHDDDVDSGQLKLAEAALGPYGDVPVAYAAIRVVLNDAGDEVVDVEFIRVNRTYCEWGGYRPENLIGHSFLGSVERANPMWFPYCYRAAVLGESVHDVVFSPDWGHWLSFNVEPSPVEGCCVCAFTIADEEHREREEMTVNLDTSDLIIDIMHVFNEEQSYEAAMNGMLETLSHVVHPDRLLVFERGEEMTTCVFEWHAEGLSPRVNLISPMPNAEFDEMNRLRGEGSEVIESEVSAMKHTNEAMYKRFNSSGVERLMGVQMLHDGEIIGYLSANNYRLEEGFDIKRVLDTVAAFIGARMANHRLVGKLEYASSHDSLTGLLNRRGVDAAIASRLASSPEATYALAIVDVDDFKTINDTYGHDVGDVVLQELANSIKEFFPGDAVLGRNGGDEFLVMLFGDDASDAEERFEQFAASGLGCDHGGTWLPVSISIGFVEHPLQARSLYDAYTKADEAVYAVKLSGKGDVKRFSPQIDEQYRSIRGYAPRAYDGERPDYTFSRD